MSSICEGVADENLVEKRSAFDQTSPILSLCMRLCIDRAITHRDAIIAGEMEHGILEHRAVSSREHKAVPVHPLRILGIVLHGLVPEDIAHRSTAHGHSRMSRLGFVHGINGNESDSVDALVLELLGDGRGGNSLSDDAN